MFAKETYIARRAKLKQTIGSGLLLFLGNDESGMNYADNTYHFRQDSTFLYFFGLPYAGLSAIIDIDNNREIIFGDELTIDAIVWMGTQPTLKEKSEAAGITEVRPFKEIETYLKNAQQKGQPIHYLPTYRAEHQIKLFQWLGVVPGAEKPSVPFIMGVVNQRNYKSEEEIAEIEKACIVTADMHLAAMRTVRPGIRESEVAAAVAEVAYANNYELSFPIIATRVAICFCSMPAPKRRWDMPAICRQRFLPMPNSPLANVRSMISRWLPTKQLLQLCVRVSRLSMYMNCPAK